MVILESVVYGIQRSQLKQSASSQIVSHHVQALHAAECHLPRDLGGRGKENPGSDGWKESGGLH